MTIATKLAIRPRRPTISIPPSTTSTRGTSHILTEWNGRAASVNWPENAFRRLGSANFITPVDRNSSPRKARHNPTALLQLVCRMRLRRLPMRDAPSFVFPPNARGEARGLPCRLYPLASPCLSSEQVGTANTFAPENGGTHLLQFHQSGEIVPVVPSL